MDFIQHRLSAQVESATWLSVYEERSHISSDIFLNTLPSFKIFNHIIGSYRTLVSVSVKSDFVHKKNTIKKYAFIMVSFESFCIFQTPLWIFLIFGMEVVLMVLFEKIILYMPGKFWYGEFLAI